MYYILVDKNSDDDLYLKSAGVKGNVLCTNTTVIEEAIKFWTYKSAERYRENIKYISNNYEVQRRWF